MAVPPIVRYMLPCDDWNIDTGSERRVTVIGLLSTIRSIDDPPYPLLHREFCVFLALTEVRGTGSGKIVCVDEATGHKVFETPSRPIQSGPDPLDVMGVAFRIRDSIFPRAGLYSVQFWYDGMLLAERPIRLR